MLRGMGAKLEAASVSAAQQAGASWWTRTWSPATTARLRLCRNGGRRATRSLQAKRFAHHPTALGHEEMVKLIEQALQ
jgi:hypothetical protein